MDEVLEQIKKHLVLPNLKISNLSGVIFLCGGKTSKSTLTPTESLRDHLCRIIQKDHPALYDRIFLAERISEWFNEIFRTTHTSDLLSFEEHISGLASAICLIVESPGSIAELGAFSMNSAINPRLMVIIRSDFNTKNSFISLGPITYLEDLTPRRESGRVFVYPWKTTWDDIQKRDFPDQTDINNIGQELIEDLLKFESENPKVTLFDPKMKGHVSLLICDLLGCFSALKIGELHGITSHAGLPDTELQLKWHLLILEKIGLIKSYTWRGTPYYVSLTDEKFIEYNFTDPPAVIVDRDRIKMRLAEEYQKKDPDRLKAIVLAKKEASGGTHA